MKSTFLLSTYVVASLALPSSNHVVNTTSGRFAPYFPPSHPGVASFPNIPYAKSPVGDLRFAAPEPASPEGNEIQRPMELPAGCMQYLPPFLAGSILTEGLDGAGLLQRGDYANTTEDCLRLSIFAPKSTTCSKEKSKLPVVVWVHGGGYVLGGTNVPLQLAPNWVQRSQKHIVVQVQYRLGLMGFPNAAGLGAEGKNLNVALLDQRLAVEWVKQNIEQLGGDPSRIILWGESAGAYAVDGYLHAWEKDPIVAGVIADSGNALLLDTYPNPAGNFTQFSKIASRFGCENDDSRKELDCMRKVPTADLKKYIQAASGEGGAFDDNLTFGTLIDNTTIFANYSNRISSGTGFAKQIPLLTGTNTNEGAAVVPYNFNGGETATILPADLQPIADGFNYGEQCYTIREVRLRHSVGAKTWQYSYAGNFSDISPRPWLGAYHISELPMVFGTFGAEGEATDFEGRVSKHMQDMYLAFAEDPNHGLERKGWPAARGKVGKREVMQWGNGTVHQLVDVAKVREECIKRGYDV